MHLRNTGFSSKEGKHVNNDDNDDDGKSMILTPKNILSGLGQKDRKRNSDEEMRGGL